MHKPQNTLYIDREFIEYIISFNDLYTDDFSKIINLNQKNCYRNICDQFVGLQKHVSALHTFFTNLLNNDKSQGCLQITDLNNINNIISITQKTINEFAADKKDSFVSWNKNNIENKSVIDDLEKIYNTYNMFSEKMRSIAYSLKGLITKNNTSHEILIVLVNGYPQVLTLDTDTKH